MSLQISSLRPETLIDTGNVKVAVTGETGRISLRARGKLAPIDKALGVKLPTKIGTRANKGDVEALCLGPDEWLILCPNDDVSALKAASEAIYEKLPHSFTDISAREITLSITGPQAAELLTIGCPRDIASIGVGEARRTVFDNASVVLWCDGPDQYRMDLWNSFAPYSADLLVTGAKELAAEAALA